MCGRFNILTDVDSLLTAFEILDTQADVAAFEPRYNISPSPKNKSIRISSDLMTKIPIIRLGGDRSRRLVDAIWPLVPVWSGGTIPKYSTANARSETMMTAPSYRNAWRHGRRCLIPATGFYEWQIVSSGVPKQPWHIRHKEQEIMSFAGLWESGRTDDGEEFESCTIVTTEANQLMADIHNSNKRMPVIVDPDDRQTWLSDDNESASQLVRSYQDGLLEAEPISTRINNPRYSNPDCLERVDI